jgi:hypothetical protein
VLHGLPKFRPCAMNNPLVVPAVAEDLAWREVENRFLNRFLLPLLGVQFLALSIFGRNGPELLTVAANCAPSVALAIYLARVLRTYYQDKRARRVSR